MLLTIHDSQMRKVAYVDNAKASTLNYFSDKWTRHLPTGASTFEFSVYKKSIRSDRVRQKAYHHLNDRAFVSFRYKGKSYVFNVMALEENEKVIKCYCETLNLELINEQVGPFKSESAMTFKSYCDQMGLLTNATLEIGLNEIGHLSRQLEWEGTDTKLSRLLSLAHKFDAEIEFDTILASDSSLKRFVVNVYHEHDDDHQGVGKLRQDVQLTYGREVSSITRKLDKKNVFTAIRPTGKGKRTEGDKEVETVVTIGGLEAWSETNKAGVKAFYQSGDVLYAPLAAQLYPSTLGGKDQWIERPLEVDSDNPKVIRAAGIKALKKGAYPEVSYEVNGFMDLEIGDTVKIHDDGFVPTLVLEARVAEQIISFTKPSENKTVFSNFQSLSNRLSKSLQARLEELFEARQDYTIKISSTKGTVFKNQTGESIIRPSLYKGVKEIQNVSWRWSLNGQVTTGLSYRALGSAVRDKSVLTVAAYLNNKEVAVTEIDLVNVNDGQDGRPGRNGENSYTHVVYANRSTEKPYTSQRGSLLIDDPWTFGGAEASKVGNSISLSGGSNPEKLLAHYNLSANQTVWAYVKLKNTHDTNALRLYIYGIANGSSSFLRDWKVLPGETKTLLTPLTVAPTSDYIQLFLGTLPSDITNSLKFEVYEYDLYTNPPFVNLTQTPTGNEEWMGIYVDDTETHSTDISKYDWVKTRGEQGPVGQRGPQGLQGIPGERGADGRTQYNHIAYAENATGGGFSFTDDTKKYIGWCQNFTETPSRNPADYRWSKWKGEDGRDGLPGLPGKDGKTPFIHTAWANSPDGAVDFSTSVSLGRRYIGRCVTYNDVNPTGADPTDYRLYRWSDSTGGFETGYANLLRNGQFKNGANHWTAAEGERLSTRVVDERTSLVFEGRHGKTLYAHQPLLHLTKDDDVDQIYTYSFWIKVADIVPGRTNYLLSVYVDGWYNNNGVGTWTSVRYTVHPKGWHEVSGQGWVKLQGSFKMPIERSKLTAFDFFLYARDFTGTVYVSDVYLHKGHQELSYHENPKDTEEAIKSIQSLTQEQVNALAEQNGIIQAELQAKLSMERFSELEKAYKAYVDTNNKNIAKSEQDLIVQAGRIEAMIKELGGLKETKTFIETYMSSSEEGLVIGKADASSTIKVTHDRISMFSAGKEVMYISQGVIHIDNGIFTKSLQIGHFITQQYYLNEEMNVVKFIE